MEVYYEGETSPLEVTTNPGESGIYKTPDRGGYALGKIEKIVVTKNDSTSDETFNPGDWTNSSEGQGSVNIWLSLTALASVIKVTPIFEGSVDNGDETYNAYFGYLNKSTDASGNPMAVTIPLVQMIIKCRETLEMQYFLQILK